MPRPNREIDVRPLHQPVRLDLTRSDLALIIDALLQAEMTLPLIDRRYRALKAIESLRAQQLSLANRLEDVLAGSGVLETDGSDSQPVRGVAESQP